MNPDLWIRVLFCIFSSLLAKNPIRRDCHEAETFIYPCRRNCRCSQRFVRSRRRHASCAAAELVAKNQVKAALGVDVNGAPRRAAAISDVCFLKPTYGTVSRYGVISTAASGEQLGVYAKDTGTVKEVMSIIAGHDQKDGTSLRNDSYTYENTAQISGKKVCIIKELFDKADDTVKAKITAFADGLKASGVKVEEISSNIFETANVAWQILMTAETCNNVSRYDGVKYGHRAEKYRNIDELYVNSRTEGFNFLTKSVILYGSDVLSKNRYKDCYQKSLKIRRIIAEQFEALCNQYDAVLTPAVSTLSFAKYDVSEAFGRVFKEGEFVSLANLIGAPSLVCGGAQLVGKAFSESTLLSLANTAERKA